MQVERDTRAEEEDEYVQYCVNEEEAFRRKLKENEVISIHTYTCGYVY